MTTERTFDTPADIELDYSALLRQSVDEMVAIERGEREASRAKAVELTTVGEVVIEAPPACKPVDVKAFRQALGVSQAVYAQLLGISTSLVRAWERGARTPEGAALRLLELTGANPYLLTAKMTVVGAASAAGSHRRYVFDTAVLVAQALGYSSVLVPQPAVEGPSGRAHQAAWSPTGVDYYRSNEFVASFAQSFHGLVANSFDARPVAVGVGADPVENSQGESNPSNVANNNLALAA